MGDKEDTETIGCGAALGTSGYIKWFCGKPSFALCGSCTRSRDAHPGAWTCPGCNFQIVEGQHFMEVVIRIDTRMPDDYKPPVEVEDTVISARFHSPFCLNLYTLSHPILRDVFRDR